MLKYPVVLVHGVGAHDRKCGTKFWGRIPEVLSSMGMEVFTGNTDSWGTYESNAATLKANIENILLKTGKEKVNIIGHSKGGLDSRYLIWKYDFGDKIASLTTICTPHQGSEIADLLFDKKITHTKFIKKGLTIFGKTLYGKLYGDLTPDLYSVNCQLTTAKMKEFNETVIADKRVFYQNLYTIMNDAFDDLRFSFGYMFLKKVSGESDGVVSERSVKWGTNTVKIAEGVSHADILDIKRKKISGVDVPDIYIKIAKDLYDKGF